MIRLFNVWYPARIVGLLAGEAFIALGLFVLVVVIRFGQDSVLVLSYEYGFYKIAIACSVLLTCMYYYDLYDFSVLRNSGEELTRLLQALGTACLVMALIYYLLPGVRLDSGLLILSVGLVGCSIVVWRHTFLPLSQSSRLTRRAIILGGGPLGAAVGEEIEKRPDWGLQLLGCVGMPSDFSSGNHTLRCLGSIDDLDRVVKHERIDEVIVALSERRGQLPVEVLLRLKAQGVQIRDSADVYESLTGKVPLDSLRLSWLLFSPGFRISRAGLVYKRLASVVFASLGLIVSLPIMLFVAVAIRLDSKGPIIFHQERVGKDGKIFKLCKFRSMRDGAGTDGGHRPAEENDERFTRVGRWIRRARLDELPQLYNILRGDMHFVGPRPFVPSQEAELAEKIPFYRQRWVVKPGATGWAQINRGYCATLEDNADKLAYDLFYIKNMSIGLDLLILFRTAKILILGRGGR